MPRQLLAGEADLQLYRQAALAPTHSTVDIAEEEGDKRAQVLYLGELYTTLGHLDLAVNFHAGAGPVWMGSSSWAAPLGHSAGRTPNADGLSFSSAVLCASQHWQDLGPLCLYVTCSNI